MGKIFPSKIENSPLIASTAEVRLGKAVSNSLLVGKVYPALQARYSEVSVLPASSLPEEMLSKNPSLSYLPHYTLKTPGAKTAVQLGPKMLALTGEPHLRQSDMMGELHVILQQVEGLGLLDHVERISLRYVNLFENMSPNKCFDLSADLNGHSVIEHLSNVRFNIPIDKFSVEIICVSDATVQDGDDFGESEDGSASRGERVGAVLDIEVWTNQLPSPDSSDYTIKMAEMFLEAHRIAKRTFFDSLKDELIESLGPSK
ncbi:TIGR04255 family protein [Burkholderia gladioli]|uniref:TIGR04255 family protein n=1 Tax=Burkholderia gladioli TaxID=28095 RepID=UPI00163FE4EB|nr:TIGR04255 family protein [Burkholderia gladioli]